MLSHKAQQDLLLLARQALRRYFGLEPQVLPPPQTEELAQPGGAFVTLHMRNVAGESMLRGCIGTVQTQKPRYQTIQEMAVAAATRDPRFEPVTKEELDDIEIEISLLGELQTLTDVNELEIGKHGLLIQLGDQRGLLLPQVASEQGWDRETFLRQTSRKAGLADDAWQKPETQIQMFSAQVFSEIA